MDLKASGDTARADRASFRNADFHTAMWRIGQKLLLRYDINTRTASYEGGAAALFGVPDIMADYPQSLLEAGVLLPESGQAFRGFFDDMAKGVMSGSVTVHMRLSDGRLRWFCFDYRLIPDGSGRPSQSVVSFFDNTEQWEKELAYEMHRNELDEIIKDRALYLEADLNTGRVDMTLGDMFLPKAPLVGELSFYELVDRNVKNYVHPGDMQMFRKFFDKTRLLSLRAQGVYSDSMEFRSNAGGTVTWYRAKIQLVKYPDGGDVRLYAVFKNVDEEHREQERLHGLASSDALTGLLNRETTMNRIESYLAGEGAKGTHVLFMIDLDNFKDVNDTLGHLNGDAVLAEMAAVIRRCFREKDVVGRIGGDEFFAFMKDAGMPGAILAKARKLVDEMQFIYASEGRRIFLSASIGIAVYHGDAEPVKQLSQLYAEADAALYKAKAVGKNGFAFADRTEKAFVPSESRGMVGLSLRSLMSNLGSGVEIFHSEPEGCLKPIVSNEPFLRLLGGLSEAEFMEIYGDDAFAGVHPEDVKGLRSAFDEAHREDNGHFQYTFRLRGKDDVYHWVKMIANFVMYADGSYDVYAVFFDAERMIHDRAAKNARYSVFQTCRRNAAADDMAAFHLNITKNTCGEASSQIPVLLSMTESGTADGFFEGLCRRIERVEKQGHYEEYFGREVLLDRFNRGEASVSAEAPFVVGDGLLLWVRIRVEMAETPNSGDVEAMVSLQDIDRSRRMQLMIRRMLKTEYEFLGQVDVKTGRLTVFSGTMGEVPAKARCEAVPDYTDEMSKTIKNLIRDDYTSDAARELSLERVAAELEHADTYVCTFPTKEHEGLREGFRQWRFGYIGARRRMIMVSRTDVTDTLVGERDTLTGLYNQQGFYSHTRERLDREPGVSFRIVRFDLDNFKVLNETLGFDKGDKLLRDIGAFMQHSGLLEDCISARMDSDHFVGLIPSSGTSPEEMVERLKNWQDSYPLDFPLTSHIGVYNIEDPSLSVSAMCDRALLALKSVKSNFTRHIGYYDESLRQRLLQEQTVSSEMEDALKSGQFKVYFQPQFNYESGDLVGAEALVRWEHPIRGLIPPSMFIPLFEANGFITTLDEYVWDMSCRYIRRWMDDENKYAPISVSVNISRVDIHSQRLKQTLLDITARNGIPTNKLKLEITESTYMQNPEQLISVVSELKAAGFTIEMDDFGSGWSSLNTLKDVPVDILKLDMKFLSGGKDKQRGGNILSSVIRMAHWLKIPVIAEGVENREQAEYLKSIGCVYMQGYYFQRPMPVEKFEVFLSHSRQESIDSYADTDLTGMAAFWDSSAQMVLLFNSFVGGAAILEYCNGHAEVVRANDKFYQELNTTREEYMQKQLDTLARFEGENRAAFVGMLEEAIRTGGEAECEVRSLSILPGGDNLWTRNRVRLLAKNGNCYLLFGAVENITEQKKLEERLREAESHLV